MAKIEISEAEKELLSLANMATGEIPKSHVEFGRMLWVAFRAGQLWEREKGQKEFRINYWYCANCLTLNELSKRVCSKCGQGFGGDDHE